VLTLGKSLVRGYKKKAHESNGEGPVVGGAPIGREREVKARRRESPDRQVTS